MTIKNRKLKIVYLLLCVFVVIACGIGHKKHKKNKLYSNTKKHSWKNIQLFNENNYTNVNVHSNLEESIFLEDVEFAMANNNNGKTIAIGRKLATKNNVTNKLFAFDDLQLMTAQGKCRAYLIHLIDDLKDDGIINSSSKVDDCFKNEPREINLKNQIVLKEVSFNFLEDWKFDDFQDALVSFLRSCEDFMVGKNKAIASKVFSIGKEQDWQPICKLGLKYYEAGYYQAFFERYFSPFMVFDKTKAQDEEKGLFTGYYLWEIKVSKKKTDKYFYPIYAMPEECRLRNQCYSRKEINAGKLYGRNLEIAWTDNPMDLYFMQVQGSGIGFLEDGSTVGFHYSGKNNLQFRSFMAYFKDNPKVAPYSDYQSILNWLNQNHDIAIEATNISDSYVFFDLVPSTLSARGSQGVPLTQSRSIAIDPYYIPYGLPIWLETYLPILDESYKEDRKWLEFNRLWISQDTGSAIKGVVRSDLFMGHGKKGEFIAKNMKFPGTMYLLIPNSLIGSVEPVK